MATFEVSADVAALLAAASAPAARTALGAETSGAAAAAQAASQPLAANLTALAADPAATVLEALQGTEADPTKFGAEYMPETLNNVILRLADMSASGAALPEGALARSGGNPIIGDGITIPGVAVGTPNTYHFTGSIQLGDADVDIRRLLTLGTFPIPAAKAVVGGRLYWRGQMWGISNGSNLNFKIGIAGTAGTLPVEGSGTPGSAQRFFGFTLGTPDAGTIANQSIASQMVFTDSAGLLGLSDGITVAPSAFRDNFLASVYTRASVAASINASAKASPDVDGVMSLYFGTEANLSTTSFHLEYDFEFTWA